jgi:hypothetical protein|tara:strand:+ start:389 stop:520 length:132 start_codon:yes stop_codon:yes gene_type:complete
MIGLPDDFNLWDEDEEEEMQEYREHYSARHEEFADRWAIQQEQ